MRFLSSLCFTQASVYQTSRLAYASSQFAVAEYERINAPHNLTPCSWKLSQKRVSVADVWLLMVKL